eukprot:PhF_6_TR33678/c0_g1_i1/m.49325
MALVLDQLLTKPVTVLCSGELFPTNPAIKTDCNFTDMTLSKGLSLEHAALSQSIHGVNHIPSPAPKKKGLLSGMFGNKKIEQVQAYHENVISRAEVCYVIRDGVKQRIPKAQVVVGDLLVIKSIQTIPCDCILLEGKIMVDCSALTGECMPIQKIAFPEGGPVTHATDAQNVIFGGTLCASGAGYALATIIGENSFMGKLAALISADPGEPIGERTMLWYGELMKKCDEQGFLLKSHDIRVIETFASSNTWIISKRDIEGGVLQNVQEGIQKLESMGITISNELPHSREEPSCVSSVIVAVGFRPELFYCKCVLGFSEFLTEHRCAVQSTTKDLSQIADLVAKLREFPKPEKKE